MSDPNNSPTTDFGYQQIPVTEKTAKVAEVFDSVANKYDLMNDIMSFGIHRWWKRFTVFLSAIKPGQQVLDIAGGTGDLAKLLHKQVGNQGQIYLADINANMLQYGRDKLINQGITGNIHYIQANAECLPFPDNYFDTVTIAFGLRNVTHKQTALNAMYRVLKPGGQLIILEFSKPIFPWLTSIYDVYSFKVLPWLGQKVAHDADSYRYLAESIRMHPDQKTLLTMLATAGFVHSRYHNLSGGIVAIHCGYKSY